MGGVENTRHQYVVGRGGLGVPVEPASWCCEGENKHSPAGLFTQGVKSKFYFISWYQGLCPPLVFPLSAVRLRCSRPACPSEPNYGL